MKKIKKFIKNNIKPIMTFVIGFLLSGGVVYATASGYLYDAQEIKFDPTDTNLNATDVQGALEELNDKAMTLKVGDYFTYTLDSTQSYTLSGSLTGYYFSGVPKDQNLDPSQITLWRIIGPWNDTTNSGQGFIGIAEKGWTNSSNYIYFQGQAGYTNAISLLNSASSAYDATGIAKGFFPGNSSNLVSTGSNANVAEYLYKCVSEEGTHHTTSYDTFDMRYTYGSSYAVCQRDSGSLYANMTYQLSDWYSSGYGSAYWFNGNARSVGGYSSSVYYLYTGLEQCLGSNCSAVSGPTYSDSAYYNYLLKSSAYNESYSHTEATINGHLRPFVKIYSNVKIASGSGTGADPYVLAAPSS